MNFRYLYILLIVILVSSCGDISRYKGYTETDSGLYYKLQAIGDGKRSPAIGDFLELVITYKTEKDSVFLDSYSSNDMGMVILPFNHSSFKGSFEEGLSIMNEGDSVSFVVDASNLFTRFFKADLPLFLKPGDMVKMDVKLHRILNSKEYQEEIERYHQLVEDRDIEEQRRIQIFLDTASSKYTDVGGIYFLPVKQGTGDFPRMGDKVRVHYTGCLLGGKQCESTYERGQPLEFTWGEQEQVIDGLKLAISKMNEGSKAKFIIPSQLAFGESGSSTGIVPPFSTLVYEIELINLTKK